MIDGIFAFYKPKGPTSHRFLNEIRGVVGRDVKVGHAGTLDPLAEGILVVGIGRGTKRLEAEVGKEKEYIAEITFGITSTTDDEEGEKTVFSVTSLPDIDTIRGALDSFIGDIDQVPPIYSAVKVGGKEAYKFARKGREVELHPRRVKIASIDILEYLYPRLVARVVTGKGVYIRSLARDLGSRLGSGGYLSGLKRVRIGEYDLSSAYTIDKFKKAVESGTLKSEDNGDK